jgi:alpha-ketoglutarate-dependent dioxygenase FTO
MTPHLKTCFLRNNDPKWKDMYQLALNTAFEGFSCDIPPEASSYFNERDIQKALNTLQKYYWFRTDVTQPYGLGSPCAKTYVTRCLLGEPGSTYKYLGLRMFAHSWTITPGDDGTGEKPKELIQAVRCIAQLNQQLIQRTQVHLSDLHKKRIQRTTNQQSSSNFTSNHRVQGRAHFDITLINRMVDTPELKKEPITGQGRCAVSWHADSTLEHYSTIAVYQTIMRSSYKASGQHSHDEEDGPWSLALRVAHHSEGPTVARTSSQTAVVEAPTLAVTLPSGSAYYLLDDFNHHHQHAVLLDDSTKKHMTPGIRYASTHRLLREGHNVRHILDRCQNSVAQFHKKGAKLWRSEQMLLEEIESEWIRQFYIQGEGHKRNLWAVRGICFYIYIYIYIYGSFF